MSRLKTLFAQLRADGRSALVTFFTAGDPTPDVTVPMLHALAEAGADIIEVGVPFSDPMADGPVIQKANERSLAGGMSLHKTIAAVELFRRSNCTTPVVLRGYLNPIEAFGYLNFSRAVAQAGVDGVITVDLSLEESYSLSSLLREAGVDPVFLIAPTSNDQRIAQIAKRASGFIYYVSIRGITGGHALDPTTIGARIARISECTALPIGVGFGIQDVDTARSVAKVADAVVIGSAIMKEIAASTTVEEVVGNATRVVRTLADAVRGARRETACVGEDS